MICESCGKQISDSANFCRNCGARIEGSEITNPSRPAQQPAGETVGIFRKILIGTGVLFMPYLFAWFTLKPGYSKNFRKLSFIWMGIAVLVLVLDIFIASHVSLPPQKIISSADQSIKSSNNDGNSQQMDNQEKVIPGIMPVDVYLNLEQKGFQTAKEFSPCCTWISTKGDYPSALSVEVYGSNASSVRRINGNDNHFNSLSSPFLEKLATLKYDGADPEKASAWVKKNISKNAKTKFGSVTFEIKKWTTSARTLSIYVE